MHCEHSREAGAYVLGSLAPAERTTFERHLAVCPVCREAVAEIAVLPGLLGRLDAGAASQIVGGEDGLDAPESRLPKLIEAAAKSRRKDAWVRRWRLAGATVLAAAVAAFASFGLLPRQDNNPPGGDQQVAMAAMTEIRETQVTAEVALTQTSAGTEVRMHCAYPPGKGHGANAYTYRLVAVGADGTRDQVGSWMAGPGSDLTLTGVTHFAYNDIDKLELQRNSGDAILVYNVP
jgi:anti-sigma factor ChrR (cupin superfamily)